MTLRSNKTSYTITNLSSNKTAWIISILVLIIISLITVAWTRLPAQNQSDINPPVQSVDPTPTPAVDEETSTENSLLEDSGTPIEYDAQAMEDALNEFHATSLSICDDILRINLKKGKDNQEAIEALQNNCDKIRQAATIDIDTSSDDQSPHIRNPHTTTEEIQLLMETHQEYTEAYHEIVAIVENLLSSADDTNELIQILSQPDSLNKLNALLDESEFQKNKLQSQMDAIQFNLETELSNSIQHNKAILNRSILLGVISLVTLIILTAWVFKKVSQVTQPILALTNAVVAIKGNQFKPELISDIAEQENQLGHVAQELIALGEESKQKQEQLTQEISTKRDQLQAARKQKLKAVRVRSGDRGDEWRKRRELDQ